MPPAPRRRRPTLQPPDLPAASRPLVGREGAVPLLPQLTNLRDMYGRPSHTTCAEEAARAWLEEQNERYESERNHQL